MRAPSEQRELFHRLSPLPGGLVYQPDFLTADDERSLIAQIQTLPLSEARYRTFIAKRRIVAFGAGYDFGTNVLLPAPPLPAFLHSLRERVAQWARIPCGDLVQCTVAEYARGTQLGWHRDVPNFGIVVGLSLASPCRMRLRPYPHVKHTRQPCLVLILEPR